MRIDDILDDATIGDLKVETAVIETAYRAIKALRQLRNDHVARRDYTEQKAIEAITNGDEESHKRWMSLFWKEDHAVNLLNSTLNELNGKEKTK